MTKKIAAYKFRKERVLLFALYFLIPPHLTAQENTRHHYSQLIIPGNLRSHLEVLSSDSLEGRETGKPGQKKAAAFISDYFSSQGLKPASHETFLQDFPISLRSNQGMNIEVNQQYFLFMKDYYYMNGYGDTTMVLDNIVFSGYGIADKNYNDYEKLNVAGKPIMFFDGEPENKKNLGSLLAGQSAWTTDWKKKLQVIYEKRPSIVFVVCDSLDRMIDSLNYSKYIGEFRRLVGSPTTIPIVFITRKMARSFFPETIEEELDRAKSKIDQKGKPKSFISRSAAFIKFFENTTQMVGQNVLGVIEGTDRKDETIVISAHYDHLGKHDSLFYPGADDNGSGTSVVMELAHIFSQAQKDGHGPRRSILFMAVSGEEKRLLGSAYYVDHPAIPLHQTVADLNIDMIGRTDEKHDSLGVRDYVYIIGSDKLSTELHHINEAANSGYTKLELDYTFNKPGEPNRYYFRSDNYNFAKNNIPIIFYFNGTHKDYHRPSDTIDKIDFDLLARRAQLVFLTAWELANRETKIRVDVKNDFERE